MSVSSKAQVDFMSPKRRSVTYEGTSSPPPPIDTGGMSNADILRIVAENNALKEKVARQEVIIIVTVYSVTYIFYIDL